MEEEYCTSCGRHLLTRFRREHHYDMTTGKRIDRHMVIKRCPRSGFFGDFRAVFMNFDIPLHTFITDGKWIEDK